MVFAVAIGLFGLNPKAALVTVVGVLAEALAMLALVWFANRTSHWFPFEEPTLWRPHRRDKCCSALRSARYSPIPHPASRPAGACPARLNIRVRWNPRRHLRHSALGSASPGFVSSERPVSECSSAALPPCRPTAKGRSCRDASPLSCLRLPVRPGPSGHRCVLGVGFGWQSPVRDRRAAIRAAGSDGLSRCPGLTKVAVEVRAWLRAWHRRPQAAELW